MNNVTMTPDYRIKISKFEKDYFEDNLEPLIRAFSKKVASLRLKTLEKAHSRASESVSFLDTDDAEIEINNITRVAIAHWLKIN